MALTGPAGLIGMLGGMGLGAGLGAAVEALGAEKSGMTVPCSRWGGRAGALAGAGLAASVALDSGKSAKRVGRALVKLAAMGSLSLAAVSIGGLVGVLDEAVVGAFACSAYPGVRAQDTRPGVPVLAMASVALFTTHWILQRGCREGVDRDDLVLVMLGWAVGWLAASFAVAALQSAAGALLGAAAFVAEAPEPYKAAWLGAKLGEIVGLSGTAVGAYAFAFWGDLDLFL